MAADLMPQQASEADFLPESSLPHAFSVVSGRVSTVLHKLYADRFGLTIVGWRLMAILGRHSPQSAKALSETTALDPVSVSRAIDQLVTLKYVSRRTDPTDRRRVVLRLSKKGEDVYNQIVPLLASAERTLLCDLQPDEAVMLRRLMDLVLARSMAFTGDGPWAGTLLGDPVSAGE